MAFACAVVPAAVVVAAAYYDAVAGVAAGAVHHP